MQIVGEWHAFDDGVERPVLRTRLQRPNAAPVEVIMLVDTGADRTVLSGSLLPEVGHLTIAPSTDLSLSGVGGTVAYRLLQTSLVFTRDDGQAVAVRGEFAIFDELASSDLSVLGRDVLDNFAVIVDRPADTVLLLAPNHRYRVELR